VVQACRDGVSLVASFVGRVDRPAGPGPASLTFGQVGAGARADLVVANATAPFAQVSYLANASQL
jgi:hypothetical protein